MTQDLATVRQAVRRKTILVNSPKPITKPDARGESDLSAVRYIVQRRARLGKLPEPMLGLVAPPKSATRSDAPETTKPIVHNHAVQENNVNDRAEDRQAGQAGQDVEELSIIDMLRSAVNQIDIITNDSKKR